MTERWDFAPASAAEFPNDNPSLHHGVSWVYLTLGGPLRPVARPRQAPPAPVRTGVTPPLDTRLELAAPVAEVALPEPSASDDASEEAAPFSLAPRALVEIARLRRAPLILEPALSDRAPPAEAPEAVLPIEAAPSAAIVDAESPAAPIEAERPAAPIEAERPAAIVEAAPPAPIIEAAPPAPIVLIEARVQALEPLALELTPSPSAELAPDAPPLKRSLELDVLEGNADDPGTGFVVASDPEAAAAPVAPSPEPAVLVAAPVEVRARESAGPQSTDAYAAFVRALVEVAMNAGATRAAACLPLLLDESGDLTALGDEARADLTLAGVLDCSGSAPARAGGFASTALAWRRVLREETNDLSACGTSTLDAWGVDLLRALGVGKDGRTDVRRELRRRGVAAFGILAAA